MGSLVKVSVVQYTVGKRRKGSLVEYLNAVVLDVLERSWCTHASVDTCQLIDAKSACRDLLIV